jgi:hypothetical protein
MIKVWLTFIMLGSVLADPPKKPKSVEAPPVIIKKLAKAKPEAISNLRPTVTALGQIEIDYLAKWFKKSSRKTIEKYALDNPIIGIKGPDGDVYIIRGQYQVAALKQAGKRKALISILSDHSKLSPTDFWDHLVQKYRVAPRTHKAKAMRLEDLPTKFSDIKNAPYQSLVHYLKRKKLIDENLSYFQQHNLAVRLRYRLPGIELEDSKDLRNYSSKAAQILNEPVIDVSVDRLYPTQASIGELEVKQKKERFAQMSFEEQSNYLDRKPIIGVRGPDGQIYLIDGHHKTKAFINAGVEKVPVNIVYDFSQQFGPGEMNDFWIDMESRGWAYPYDNQGLRMAYRDLPKTLKMLEDDPYRSLAWYIRKSAVYSKETDLSGKPFLEFEWAEFIRKKMPDLELNSVADLEKIADEVLAIVQSEDAFSLRGHLKGISQIKCLLTNPYPQ